MPNFVNRRQIYSFEDTKMGYPILEIPDLFSKKQTLSGPIWRKSPDPDPGPEIRPYLGTLGTLLSVNCYNAMAKFYDHISIMLLPLLQRYGYCYIQNNTVWPLLQCYAHYYICLHWQLIQLIFMDTLTMLWPFLLCNNLFCSI